MGFQNTGMLCATMISPAMKTPIETPMLGTVALRGKRPSPLARSLECYNLPSSLGFEARASAVNCVCLALALLGSCMPGSRVCVALRCVALLACDRASACLLSCRSPMRARPFACRCALKLVRCCVRCSCALQVTSAPALLRCPTVRCSRIRCVAFQC